MLLHVAAVAAVAAIGGSGVVAVAAVFVMSPKTSYCHSHLRYEQLLLLKEYNKLPYYTTFQRLLVLLLFTAVGDYQINQQSSPGLLQQQQQQQRQKQQQQQQR